MLKWYYMRNCGLLVFKMVHHMLPIMGHYTYKVPFYPGLELTHSVSNNVNGVSRPFGIRWFDHWGPMFANMD